MIVFRDQAASVWKVAGAEVGAVVQLSAPFCVLPHDKSTLVPTELDEIKLGYRMGWDCSQPRSNNRIDWITCRAVIQAFTINWIFTDAQSAGHSRKRGEITFSLAKFKEINPFIVVLKTCSF